jgi:hypothetical protein
MRIALIQGVCAVIALVVLPFSAANAEIYKCSESGKTIFQDVPCKGAGAAIKVQPANGAIDASVAPKAPSEGTSAATRLKENVKTMEGERRQRELDYAIVDAEGDVRQL